MVLVADSGSTKTHWMMGCLDGSRCDIVSVGLPPRMTTDEQFREVTRQVASQLFAAGSPQHIFFYGSGCSGAQHQERYRCLLQEQWPMAVVTVESDLMGACRALLSDGSGLVGILGTGSNACRYVDGAIVSQLPSLGYLMGDEGSGYHLEPYCGNTIGSSSFPRICNMRSMNSFHTLCRNFSMQSISIPIRTVSLPRRHVSSLITATSLQCRNWCVSLLPSICGSRLYL